ncbi:MAG: cobalamin-binding protein [Anaerolineales bacterium]|nr:cobalamin-binding protein [Anaerolineales bacterium]
MDKNIETIYKGILEGDQHLVVQQVTEALNAGLSPDMILKEGLVAAMGEVGRLFENGEYYVPEMLIAARAMQAGMKLLKPGLADTGIKEVGRVIIGTVSGDLHDIGKNLVGMMLEGSGFEVIDLGTDVKPEAYVNAVREYKPNILAMSALLTTTMPNMEATIKALEEAGLRQQVKVIIGGAPVTEEYAKKIGADGSAYDASVAVKVARSLIR